MRLLQRAVQATARWPLLRSAYAGLYAGAAQATARSLGALDGVSAVYLHRGLTHDAWTPGVSDIDLILLREPAADACGERAFLEALSKRLAALKAAFPMLGEALIADAGELRSCLAWGGLRAREDAPAWRRLWARPPASGAGEAAGASGLAGPAGEASREDPEKRRWLDPWAGAFVSHMEVCRRLFAPQDEPAAKRLAHARKFFLDGRRYAGAVGGEGLPATRGGLCARLPGLDRLGVDRLWLESALELAEASRRVLARLGRGETARADLPGPSRDGTEPAGPLPGAGGLSALRSRSGAAAAVSDLPYHSYLILDESAGAQAYERAGRAVLEDPPAGVPMILTPSSWALALQSSYLGSPLGWLGWGGERRPPPSSGPFANWGAWAVGEPLGPLPILPRRLRWEAAAEAAAWMALWWRTLWIGRAWPNRFVLFHLYTRALGLRLALEGAEVPFSYWEELIGRGVAARAGDEPFLESLGAFMRSEPAECLDLLPRAGLAPGHFANLFDLAAALRPALSRPEPSCPSR